MVCVDFLFRRFPDADPQWLTEHKTAMVSNQFLGCLCIELGFHNHMACLHNDVLSSIRNFAKQLREVKELAEAEAKEAEEAQTDINGTSSSSLSLSTPKAGQDFWLKVDQPAPKCLPDIVEAIIGAIFVDSRYDFSAVASFFERCIRPYFEDMRLYDSFASRHPVTLLATRLTGEFGCREWRILVLETTADPDECGGTGVLTESRIVAGVLVHKKVVQTAGAASGRYAKVAAANKALKWLGGFEAREEFVRNVGCDCNGKSGEGEVDTEETGIEAHGTAI
jgi:endoribonuclease Dicer